MFFNSILASDEKRSYSATDDFWYTTANAASSSGLKVNPRTALKVSALYACVSILAQTMAGLPRQIFQNKGENAELVRSHPLNIVLNKTANQHQTAFEFWEMQIGLGCIYSNSYAKIVPGELGAVTYLEPMRPDCVVVEQFNNGRVRYKYRNPLNNYKEEILLQEDVFHIPGFSMDGIAGIPILNFANDAVGLALATELFGSRFFARDATPAVVLEHPKTLKPEAKTNIRDSWVKNYGGVQNAHSVAVIEEDMKVKVLSAANRDSQFLETRKYQIAEIARFFRIPLHMINELEKSSFNNIEQQSIEFVKYTILPWCKRIEMRIDHQLMLAPDKYYTKHNVDALLRGETLARYQAYEVGIRSGFLLPDEVRAKENLNPLPDGYVSPMEQQFQQGNKQKVQVNKDILNPIAQDISERMASAEIEKHQKLMQRIGVNAEKYSVDSVTGYAQKHLSYCLKILKPYEQACELLGFKFNSGAYAQERYTQFILCAETVSAEVLINMQNNLSTSIFKELTTKVVPNA